jgi:hypothetical protein
MHVDWRYDQNAPQEELIMTRIVVDADLRAKLLDLRQPLELCDGHGQVVAHLFPSIDLSDYEPWEPPMDEEELRRREANERRYTTAEVLAHLHQRDQS